MTELQRKQKIQELTAKRDKLLLSCRPMQAATITRQIKALEIEQIPLKSLLPNMSEQDRKEALRLMHRTFILADLLEGAAIDFESYLNKFGTMRLLITDDIKQIAKMSHKLIMNIDDMKDEKLSENFGDMSDECKFAIYNVISKYQAKQWK